MSSTFTKPSDLIAGTTARAEDINNRVNATETGFDNVEVVTNRSLKLPVGTVGDQLISESAPNRALKEIGFDANGDLVLIGTAFQWKGDWLTSTAYVKNDVVRDGSTKNIYTVQANHTSGVLATDVTAAKLSMAINVVDVETAKTAAQTAQALSEDWAEKTTGVVTGTSYSAKHWATTGTVQTVSTNIADINTTADDIASVNTTATSIANVNIVAPNIANVNKVGAIDANVTTVANNDANVTIVAGNNANITTVASNNTNVTTVAGISADVTSAAGISANITTVAGNTSNINIAAGISADITTAASISSAISTNATNITAIQNADANATTATTQAGIATTKASEAANSATAAANSASSLTNAETNSANSATAAATSLDSFQDIYLGTASANPTTDLDGDALVAGALHYNTTANSMRVYSGSSWADAGSAVNGTSDRVVYTATAAQTTFAVTYDAGFVDVYLNGIKLLLAVDFAGTSGTSVVLTTGATVGDIVDIVSFGSFALADHYTKVASDARYLAPTGDGSGLSGLQSPLVAGTDYLAPTGDGSNLTGITDTTYSIGDGGLTQVNFTTADNTKLDGIAVSANNYTLPATLPASMLTGALPAISGAALTNLPASGFSPLFEKSLFGGI